MSLKVARLHLRLFLEGIEVPVISGQVAGAVGQTAVATIQIVPTSMAHQILNRTKVDLFFHDLYSHSEAARSRVAYGSASSVDGVTWQQRFSPMVPETPDDGEIRRQTEDGPSILRGGGETLDTLQIPQDLLTYRLLFTGELIGIAYVKETGTRGVVLQCAGNSSYWDMIAADKRGGQLFGGDRRTAFQGMTQSPFWDLLNGATGEVFEKLTHPPTTFPNLKGFTAGLMHIMEGIFGVYHRSTRDGAVIVGGANQVMSMASIRLKLLQQIGVAGGDDCPIRLMRRSGFGSIWRTALRGLPRYFGFRHMLNALMPYTFYEHTPVLAPYYTPPTGYYANMANWGGFSTGYLRNSPEWNWIARSADGIRSIVDNLTGPDGDLGEIASQIDDGVGVNIEEYDDLITVLKGKAARIKSLARAIYSGVTTERTRTDDIIESLEATPTGEETPPQSIYREPTPEEEAAGMSFANPEEEAAQACFATPPQPTPQPVVRSVTRRYREALDRLEPVAARAREIEGSAGSLLSALDRTTLPGHPDNTVNSLLSQIKEGAVFIGDFSMQPPSRGDDDADSEPAHLYCDMLRPDVWFCAPPRSNVFFPDHYSRIAFNRVFHQESTRLLVKMHNRMLGSDPFFDKWWIAPLSTGLFTGRQVGRSGEARTRIKRDLMEHELLGGIIPEFQSMSDRDMFLGAKVAGFGGHPTELSNDQRRYFQQVCNFLLFRKRFSARTMQIDCRFNPYAILGFPAVVLDSPTNETQTTLNQMMLNTATEALAGVGEDPSAVVLELIKKRTGAHYLGTVYQMTHTASAVGESSGTTIMLSQARRHNEKIEMLGQDVLRLSQAAQRTGDQTVHRRSAEVDRLIREIQVWQERLNAYTGTGLRDEGYSSGLIYPQEGDPTALEAPTVGGRQTLTGTHQQVSDQLSDLRTQLEQMPEEVRRIHIEAPTRRTSNVFAIDPPIPRRGTAPDTSGEGASDDYARGQTGPYGGEIIEAEDVTDQFRNSRRSRNVSGWSASDVERYRSALEGDQGLEHRLEQDQSRLLAPPPTAEEMEAGTSLPRTADDSAQQSEQAATVGSLQVQVQNLRGIVNEYDRGWRTEYVTLPFINTPKDGRNRPVTVITSDRVGVETDVRQIPELLSIVGDPTGQAATVILKVYRIVEDMAEVSGEIIDLGAEDVLRPPWYSNYWNNALIGGGVYMPYFGIGSVVDPIAIMKPESIDLFMEPTSAAATMAQTRTQIQYQETGSGSSQVQSGILEGATIENAIDWLAHTYSLTRMANYDVDAFIYNYTWRPIATIFDMFGSGDLTLDENGERVVSGVEGFHSRAFGPWANLFGLMPFNDLTKFLGITSDDVAGAARVDVRSRRYAVIQAYRVELLRSRGCAL